MSLNEKIADLLEEELKLRMDLLLTEYAETISKKYQISLQLLLKDIPCVSVTSTCMGTKPDGSRCTFKGIHNGYCGKHQKQGEKIKQRFHETFNGHTHGPGLRNVTGCPACERSFSANRLIDLDSLLNNE
jgi:hypothetical protein